jgi:hypothetical protein
VIAAAALCPWPPLLVRELTGAGAVLPELRAACDAAATALLAAGPDLVTVVGPGPVTAACPADGRLDVAAFGGLPGTTRPGPGRPVLPPGPGLGAYLLDRAGYTGPRVIWSVGAAESPAACARLGRRLAAAPGRTALLVMGDGSARRSPRAPGYYDERAAPFDEAVEQAARAGDMGALLALDPGLARDLMATGRPAWQVLAGALTPTPVTVDVRYAGDPLGVKYLVASLVPSLP